MQLRQLRVAVLLTCAVLLVEYPGELLDRLALPRRNLSRMQAVPGRQLRNRLVALDRFQWPAPGFIDTRLSESRLHLELHGT